MSRRRGLIPQEEGESFPGRTYAEAVLEPAFEQAKLNLLEPMLAVHKAHLTMLLEQRLLSADAAGRIASALLSLNVEALQQSSYTGQFEDLFFQVEHELHKLAGPDAGSLHIGRSRNDMGIAIYRMKLREELLHALSAANMLRECVLDFSREHADTIMIGYTHTQQAQPTTLGHYAAAVFDVLARDVGRLMAAYHRCNLSPMGAAALTTSGYALDRERMRQLLGFAGLVANSYDAVCGADYAAETQPGVA
jgi:argininosuccinate lyase